ncbi:lysylphosphatidylglycerol synthase transmembrane domain-containing protein [Carboxydochorda subterranea]|uniref:Phosphatidylglycerol lysyltransferase n=1 Tax=Carboxydichorda subterranea TaxID=3109565 RepID=A0ABZ1BWI8_9FIRM|nr:lysylphosphatidylglycerol synthase transmembrane domain-containing protein [Limnochorda sp. L945t]WRP17061.1 lysylphosphatidylglycerol synthase transmembrane domain-containing protein [Limnochorda sp. L945t]
MQRQASRLSRRGMARGVTVSLAVGAASVAALLIWGRDGDDVTRQLGWVDPWWLTLAGGLTLLAWQLRTWRSQLLARAMDVRVPAGRMFRYYLASVFVSHVTPTSTGGLPVFVYLLTREGLTFGQATAVAVVDSGLVVLWLLAAWPVVIAWRGLGAMAGSTPALSLLMLLSLALMAAFVVGILWRPRWLAVFFLMLRRRLAKRHEGRRGRWVQRALARIARESLRFAFAVRRLVIKRPWLLAGATLLTGVYWAVYLSIAWSVLIGLGARIAWAHAALAQLVFNLAQAFIPTPGGSGGAELLMAYLFRGTLPGGRLAAFVGAWRFFTFYASLAVGGAMFVRSLRGVLDERGTSFEGEPPGGPGLGRAGSGGRRSRVAAEPVPWIRSARRETRLERDAFRPG